MYTTVHCTTLHFYNPYKNSNYVKTLYFLSSSRIWCGKTTRPWICRPSGTHSQLLTFFSTTKTAGLQQRTTQSSTRDRWVSNWSRCNSGFYSHPLPSPNKRSGDALGELPCLCLFCFNHKTYDGGFWKVHCFCFACLFLTVFCFVIPELPNYKPKTAWKTDRFRPDSKGTALSNVLKLVPYDR